MEFLPRQGNKNVSLQNIFPGNISIRYKKVLFRNLLRSGHWYTKLPTKMKPILKPITAYSTNGRTSLRKKSQNKIKSVYCTDLFFLRRFEKYILLSLSYPPNPLICRHPLHRYFIMLHFSNPCQSHSVYFSSKATHSSTSFYST